MNCDDRPMRPPAGRQSKEPADLLTAAGKAYDRRSNGLFLDCRSLLCRMVKTNYSNLR